MRRRSVRREEVPELLAELEERGARSVRRHPADLSGRVEVTWEEGALEEVEPFAADAWSPAFGVTAGFVFLVVVTVLALTLLG